MTTARPYRAAMSKADATAELRANAGTQFNPVVVEALIAAVQSSSRAQNGLNGQLADQTQIFQLATEAARARTV
jgi:HD-GYP domain-containing protein (c-di-GMP phosphodiesterase class II)